MGKTTRVIVCGMKSVGKTAILEQAIYGNYTKDSVSIPNVKYTKLNISSVRVGYVTND